MRKIFWMLFVALLTASCSSDSVEGNTEYLTEKMISVVVAETGQMFFWDNGNGTVSVTYDRRNPMHTNINSGKSNDYYKGVVTIPSSITVDDKTMQVTAITEYAFMNCTGLTKVVVPASVKSIGEMAFYGCTALEMVEVQGDLTEIPDYCFYGDKALKSFTALGQVTRIGVSAFARCTNLTSLKVPEGVKTIDTNCFQSSGVTYVVLPEGLTQLKPLAFSTATKLKEIGIPATVTALADSVFYGCSALLTAYLPETLQTIGTGTFAGCRSIMEMTIPATVTNIGAKCFYSEDANGESNSKSLILNVMATEPPTLAGSITNATDYSRIVVPKGCRKPYLAASYWNEFTQIMERNY